MQLIDTPFLDRDGVTLYKMLPPTLGDVDSITEFTTKSDDELQNEHELGDTGANPGFMTQGLNKQRFLMGLPTLLSKSNHYMMMTAQVGKAINIKRYIRNLMLTGFGTSCAAAGEYNFRRKVVANYIVGFEELYG